MAEKDLAKAFCQLTQSLFPVRIENALYSPGLPDLCLVSIGAWVELKWAREWPKRGGPLRLPHFTMAQKAWAAKCLRRGGRCYLCVMCKGEWFIYRAANEAYAMVGNMAREEMIERADWYFESKPSGEELCAVFTS